MSDKETRKLEAQKRLAKLKKTHLVGKGSTEKISTKRISKTGGFTEHIDDIMRETSGASFREKIAKKIRLRKIAKLGGKIPAIGAIAGPVLTLAATGNPNEALASALDSEDLGAGSDTIGDQGLSRAERLRAERRVIQARSKGKK